MADNAYSRLVGLLKVVLPLAALALLSMLFLVARTLDPESALPYAQVDIQDLLRDQRLTAPTYSGVTKDGDEVIFTAETAHPGGLNGTGAHAVGPLLRLIGPGGSETTARAAEARVNPAAQELALTGAVRIVTGSGARVATETLLASLDRSHLSAPGAVVADLPQGRVEAGGFDLTRGNAAGQEVLVFKGGVRLLYQAEAPGPNP